MRVRLFESLHVVLLIGLAANVMACATSPTGRRQLMIVPESYAIQSSLTAYQNKLAPFEQRGKVDNDARLKQRVEGITQRLVVQAVAMRPETQQWDWSVHVIDEPETLNAFAMSGGKMAIYTGIILKIRSTDDEIAQVMGHEIAHALARHGAEKLSVVLMKQLGVAGIAIATRSNAAGSLASTAATLALQLPNSRSAETEADRIGIELAAKAGYDPRAAATLWQKMAQATSGRSLPEFLNTHPASERRMETLAALAPEMMPYYEAAKPKTEKPAAEKPKTRKKKRSGQ